MRKRRSVRSVSRNPPRSSRFLGRPPSEGVASHPTLRNSFPEAFEVTTASESLVEAGDGASPTTGARTAAANSRAPGPPQSRAAGGDPAGGDLDAVSPRRRLIDRLARLSPMTLPMTLSLATDQGPVALRVVRWIARAASLASLGLLGLFATSGGEAPSTFEWVLLACFPIGVGVGMVLAWFREVLGGVVTLGSLAAFHLLLLLDESRPPSGPWFLVLASPGIVLLVVGLIARRSARRSA